MLFIKCKKDHAQRCIQNPVKNLLEAINCFCKMLHLWYLTGFWNTSNTLIYTFFYKLLHYQNHPSSENNTKKNYSNKHFLLFSISAIFCKLHTKALALNWSHVLHKLEMCGNKVLYMINKKNLLKSACALSFFVFWIPKITSVSCFWNSLMR